jgi:integrase
MADALAGELLLRNPAAAVQPPTVADVEVEILKPEQVKEVLAAMRETSIYPHVVVLLATGMRRGELIGLQWDDLDLDSKMVKIVRSVEKTKAKAKGQPCSLRIKAPKTKAGRRQITLPEAAVAVLREHKKALLELRLRLGLGRLLGTAFVFGTPEGQPRDPDRITQDWKRFTAARNLPKVKLHALRHTHASALIAAHHDIVTISRRLGHYSPVVTLSIYAHLFENKGDGAAAQSMNAVFAP